MPRTSRVIYYNSASAWRRACANVAKGRAASHNAQTCACSRTPTDVTKDNGARKRRAYRDAAVDWC
jgi:hypothetical protein